MSRFAGIFLLICLHLHAGLVYADMDCSILGQMNLFDRTINSNRCPGLMDSSDKAYCCTNQDLSRIYCCDAEEFALKTGLNIIIPVIIAAAVVIGLIVCCISCLCCSCCPWYRRRHQGTVYGRPGVA